MTTTLNVSSSTVIINHVSNSFNDNKDCNFDNSLSLSKDVRKKGYRTFVSHEEFCATWTRYYREGLGKISEVLNVTPKWAWFRYMYLTNPYNNVDLPVLPSGHPAPVDAESLNALISTILSSS